MATLWAHFIPILFSGPLERLDLHAVTLLTGGAAKGNYMDYRHGPGGIIVAWGCTSFANASFALLLWMALTRTLRPMPKSGEWRNLAAVFMTIFAINTVRLALMGQSVETYQRLHGATGNFWLSMLLFGATLAWCLFGLRHELVS
jgi:hypothetical protein